MGKNLVIVESPAKAKTIEKFLGSDFTVKSSFGHIRDLEKKDLGVDIEKNFTPKYLVLADKKKIVADLKKLVSASDTVWLASDEDREGEAIAWHLYEVLGLKKKDCKRIVFHEITKDAILNAVKNPGEINLDLVNAQQARRILDRIVGFELSSVLWKKVKSSLSAGRVQSVAVRLLVEREREIINFKQTASFRIYAVFDIIGEKGEKIVLKSELSRQLKDEKEVFDFLNKYGKSTYTISDVQKKPGKRTPPAPFTTSTLQQEAARKLGFPVGKTMLVAQQLYESGMITYMRTDSVNLSDTALNAAKKAILADYGEKYLKIRKFKTKTKGAQEAHEAIRPTYIENADIKASLDEIKLYDLIRKRTMASQMEDALFEKTTIDVAVSGGNEKFITTGEVLVFDGFLKAYSVALEDDAEEENSVLLPPVSVGQILNLNRIESVEKFTKHLPRYGEATLVRKLEELGIGRPSTYAPTISTIQKRGYVIKENRDGAVRLYQFITYKNGKISQEKKNETIGTEKAKLFPTDIGMVVTDFLKENFERIVDFNFTADVEKEFDDIAEGKIVWYKMLDKFYKDFKPTIDDVIENSDRNAGEKILGIDTETGRQISARLGKFGPIVQVGLTTDEQKPQYVSLPKDLHIETLTLAKALDLLKNAGKGRLIGTEPVSKKNVYARIGRFGPMIQIGETDDEEKPRYASLQKGMNVDTVTMTEAMELFKLPRTVGEFENKKVVVSVGRFGPYISHDSKFVSLGKTDDPMTIEMERAITLIQEKRQKDSDRLIKEFPENKDITIIKDRWGRPCVFYKKKYFNLAKIKKEPKDLTLEDCMEIANVKPTKEKAEKKTTAKKTEKKTTKPKSDAKKKK
jgi:DNA topoisomerase-1